MSHRRIALPLIAVVALAVAMLAAAPAFAGGRPFTTSLSGPSEVPAGDPDEEADQEQPGQEAEQDRAEYGPAAVRRLGVDHDAVLGEQRSDGGGVYEGGHLRLELRHLHRFGVQ